MGIGIGAAVHAAVAHACGVAGITRGLLGRREPGLMAARRAFGEALAIACTIRLFGVAVEAATVARIVIGCATARIRVAIGGAVLKGGALAFAAFPALLDHKAAGARFG